MCISIHKHPFTKWYTFHSINYYNYYNNPYIPIFLHHKFYQWEIAGIPVFVGGIAGLGYITGPYGGYNVAFLLTSIFIPMICKRKYNRLYFSMIAILSAIIIDLTGTIWIMAVSKISFKAAFAVGFIPFILFDIIKAVLAAQLVPQLRIIINNFEN